MNDLDRLEHAKRQRPGARQAARLLRRLRTRRFRDAESLIRFHDLLLFLRAYPHSRQVLGLSESLLSTFGDRMAEFAAAGGDLSEFDDTEVSGISRTSVTTDYSYDVVRWMHGRFGRRVRIDWDGYEGTDRLRAAWPEFLPLLEEEAIEDANVAYRDYLGAARPGDELEWVLSKIDPLPLEPREKSERFDALGFSVTWEVSDGPATRTHQRVASGRPFFHDEPLLARRDVSLDAELSSPPMPMRRLDRREGAALIERAREATALRYREYYAFTFADPNAVLRADAGRGLQIFLAGTQRDRRLPLRSGYGGFLVKNGVPIGYFEALAFLERMEVGFNLYYAFREGESAWTFARSLKLLHQALGVTSFSLDPYQIGHENEEAVKSGAFWFYRKLGFESTSEELRALTAREEAKIAANPTYRSSSVVLRRLASANLLFSYQGHDRAGGASPSPTARGPGALSRHPEGSEAAEGPSRPSRAKTSWDHFHIRNISFAVIRRMARDFGGDADRIREASERSIARALGISPSRLTAPVNRAFSDFALVLDLIPDLPRWTGAEKEGVLAILRAKAGPAERTYLRLLQRHSRLRAELLRLGSKAASRQ